jgi:hypothetical protein
LAIGVLGKIDGPGFAMLSSRATKPAIANEICDRIAASVRVSLIAQSAG